MTRVGVGGGHNYVETGWVGKIFVIHMTHMIPGPHLMYDSSLNSDLSSRCKISTAYSLSGLSDLQTG